MAVRDSALGFAPLSRWPAARLQLAEVRAASRLHVRVLAHVRLKGMTMRRESDASGRRVLLVEDESRLREMLLRAIGEMGFEPVGAGSAEQAQRTMEHRPAPVVIVDLNLPGASGLDLLRTVRSRWPATQAIVLTGFGDLDAARQAIRLDVVDFLTKPCARRP